MSLDNQTAVKIFYKMLKARLFEQEAYRIKEAGYISGPLYLSIGQEATVAAVSALNPNDVFFAPHRNFHLLIGADVNIERLFRELVGESGGICAGQAGPYSCADNSINFYGTSALSGAQFGKAVGAALSFKLQNFNNVVAVFSGDGAAAQGSFFEAVNAACLHRLHVVFFVENNCYAGSLRTDQAQNVRDISTRAAGFEIPGILVDGNDAYQVYDAMMQAMDYTLTAHMPVIVESKTYRLTANRAGEEDPRPEDEINEWREYDAIDNMARYLIENGAGIADDLMMMREKIESDMIHTADTVLASLAGTKKLSEWSK